MILNAEQQAILNGEKGEGVIIHDQIPKPNVEVLENSTIILYTDSDIEKVMVTVPDLFGRNINDATTILKNVGLNINTEGLGIASTQSPKAGTKIERGSIVNVTFKITEVD